MTQEFTRNYYLEQILIAEGGTPGPNDTMDVLLEKAVIAAGGSVTQSGIRNSLLNDFLEAKGGTRVDTARNEVIETILTQLSVIFPDNMARNKLLSAWDSASIPNVVTYDLGVVSYQGDGNPVIYPP